MWLKKGPNRSTLLSVKKIKCKIRQKFSEEDKTRNVLAGLRGETSQNADKTDLCDWWLYQRFQPRFMYRLLFENDFQHTLRIRRSVPELLICTRIVAF